MQRSEFSMEDAIKRIFTDAVNSVKASELITKNKFIKFYQESDQNFIEIKQKNHLKKIDVTGKKIHLGERHWKLQIYGSLLRHWW